MGQTCCNIASNLEQKIEEEDFQKCESFPQLSAAVKKFMEENKVSVWKKKQQNKFYIGLWVNGNAQGEGVLLYPEQLCYEGMFGKGVMNGKGELSLKKKEEVYKGQFIEGQAHGKGVLINEKEGIQFEGEWFCSKPVSGSLKFANPQVQIDNIIISDFNSNRVVINFRNKTQYRGEVDEKLYPCGQGSLIYPSESRVDSYKGQWENGLFHGMGSFVWKDGSSYQGQYSHGKKQGEGKYTFASKKYYEGHWLAGQQNGRGKLSESDGSVIKQGIWQKGVFLMELKDDEMAPNSDPLNL